MGIVRLKEFEEGFESDEIEIYALLKEAPAGCLIYNKDYRRPLVHTFATMDCKTEVLDQRDGILVWLISKDHPGYGYDFRKYGIYRLLVRKAKIKTLDEYTVESWNNRYWVLDILESDVKQNELEKLASYYQQPIIIKTQTGEFTLNREYNFYELQTLDFNVFLGLDRGSEEKCSKALKVFKKYEMNLPDFDIRLKKYVAEHMLDEANEWRKEEGEAPITEEDFFDAISLSDLDFRGNGKIEACYDDGDIFAGHCIIVDVDSKGIIVDAYLAG